MPKLYSYVVDHDHGFAPCPFCGFCTLAKCKYGSKKRNIVEMAEEGDWIAGTGGVDLCKSAGHGKLIYAMRVDEKIPLREYCRAHGGDRIDAGPEEDDFSVEFVEDFARWLKANFKVGVHGRPCAPHSELEKCPAKVRRRGCA